MTRTPAIQRTARAALFAMISAQKRLPPPSITARIAAMTTTARVIKIVDPIMTRKGLTCRTRLTLVFLRALAHDRLHGEVQALLKEDDRKERELPCEIRI